MPPVPFETETAKIIDLDYLELKAYPHRSMIRLFWKRQVNNTELRTGFYTAVQVAQTYGCTLWLGDARNTTMLDIADQNYLVKDLVEMISKSGIKKVARLVTKEEATLEKSFSMKLKIESEHAERISFETDIFTDETEAIDWLSS